MKIHNITTKSHIYDLNVKEIVNKGTRIYIQLLIQIVECIGTLHTKQLTTILILHFSAGLYKGVISVLDNFIQYLVNYKPYITTTCVAGRPYNGFEHP